MIIKREKETTALLSCSFSPPKAKILFKIGFIFAYDIKAPQAASLRGFTIRHVLFCLLCKLQVNLL